jgi:hypothetical protein
MSFSFIILHEAAERRNLASRSKIITRVLTDRGIRRRSFHLTVRLVPVHWINLKRNCNKQNCNQRSELSTAPTYLILSIDFTIHHMQQHARNCSREENLRRIWYYSPCFFLLLFNTRSSSALTCSLSCTPCT